MNAMRVSLFLAGSALALLLHAGPALATDQQIVELTDPAEFPALKDSIERDLFKGKVYRELSMRDHERVVTLLERMADTLAGVDAIDQLALPERTELFNQQEEVNALLTEARDDSRLVCKRERRGGSNIPRTYCHTEAERERMRQDGREAMRKKQLLSNGPRGL